MGRTDKEAFIIGAMSLVSNRLSRFGDELFPDITYKQWFLLRMISKMEGEEKSLNQIADFVGTTRQNVKKMIVPLEKKGYVVSAPSKTDGRALCISLTRKTYRFFKENDGVAEQETDRLFSPFSDDEIDYFSARLHKLVECLEKYPDSI